MSQRQTVKGREWVLSRARGCLSRWAAALGCCVLAGCTATPPLNDGYGSWAYVPRPPFSAYVGARADQGVVYVYRPEAHGLAALTASIEIDGKPVARLENNQYAVIPLGAGAYTITQRWKRNGIIGDAKWETFSVVLPVKVNPGTSTYVRLKMDSSWRVAGLLAVHNQWACGLQEVADTEAMKQLQECRLGEPVAGS